MVARRMNSRQQKAKSVLRQAQDRHFADWRLAAEGRLRFVLVQIHLPLPMGFGEALASSPAHILHYRSMRHT